MPLATVFFAAGLGSLACAMLTMFVFIEEKHRWSLVAWLAPLGLWAWTFVFDAQSPRIASTELLPIGSVEIPGRAKVQVVVDGDKVQFIEQFVGHRHVPDGCMIAKTTYEEWYVGIRYRPSPTYRVVKPGPSSDPLTEGSTP